MWEHWVNYQNHYWQPMSSFMCMYIHRLYKNSTCTKLTAWVFYGSDSECKNEYDEKKLNTAFKVVE